MKPDKDKRNSLITPLDAFVVWFDAVPLVLRKHLAHIFQICTTEDARQMAVCPERSLASFRHWAAKTDFPLRIAARMFYIRSVFDMVICHHEEMADEKNMFGSLPGQKNIVQISLKQWELTLGSWLKLRQGELSDRYIHSWTSWIIKQSKELK